MSFPYTMGTADICVETFQGLFNPETNRDARILILEKIFCWSSAPKTTKGQWTSDLVNGLVLSQWPCFLWTKVSHWKLVPLNPQRFRFFHVGGQKPEWCCTWPVSTSCPWENLISKDYLVGENDDEQPLKKRVEGKSYHFLKATQKWRFSKTANINISRFRKLDLSAGKDIRWLLTLDLGQTRGKHGISLLKELGWFCRVIPSLKMQSSYPTL